MRFTKSEKNIIAYSVSFLENEINSSSSLKKDFRNILAKLQEKGFWGMIEDQHFEEDDNTEQLLEEIQDITETEPGDFGCSTCDQVNSLAKDR